ncbi:32 kDa beta-galactoside-binding lectin lec-3-like [Physella acuta]|uniref:32 kDa beta-galactoside-binding lectin lec-3-like n=1 Tax=Physella acuta TaxID=109671 RepID=UPI0027DB526D|nr:32 kDa beta-galactoside-binding lectin lec-3-like [Physella acuta]XP_059140266.1 32 kDa beta-galactoside-binding lectin lec-3-like [Physella acuta]
MSSNMLALELTLMGFLLNLMSVNCELESMLSYSEKIKYPIDDQKTIIVEAFVPQTSQNFMVSLSDNEYYSENIPLQVYVDFNQNYVEITYQKDGLWSDEKDRVETIPFVRGKDFEFKIALLNNLFKLSINEVFFRDFNLQMSKDLIHYIHVDGNVDIKRIFYSPKVVQLEVDPAGEMIIVNGFPTKNTERFTIFLTCSSGLNAQNSTVDNIPDITMAFDVRFTGNAIVINHKTNNEWGMEEVFKNHKFEVNIPFQLKITLLPGYIEIDHKGVHKYTYKHKIEQINYFGYGGNVHVSDILTT